MTNIFGMDSWLATSNERGENNPSNVAREEATGRSDFSQEGDPNPSSAVERGTTLPALEEPTARIEERPGDLIGINATTLYMLKMRQQANHHQVIEAVIRSSEQHDGSRNNLPIAAPINTAGVHFQNERIDNANIEPVALSEYLESVRKELKAQQSASSHAEDGSTDDQQLKEDEVALNRAVLSHGVSLEELRALRAIENDTIAKSILKNADLIAQQRKLERDSNSSPHGPYMATFQDHIARREACLAAAVARQTAEESQRAINVAIERGYTPSVATPIEEITPREETSEPTLRRQTYSF